MNYAMSVCTASDEETNASSENDKSMPSSPRLGFAIVNHEFPSDGKTPVQIVQGLVKRRAERCVDVTVLGVKSRLSEFEMISIHGDGHQEFGPST
jgi:hypothetical protein